MHWDPGSKHALSPLVFESEASSKARRVEGLSSAGELFRSDWIITIITSSTNEWTVRRGGLIGSGSLSAYLSVCPCTTFSVFYFIAGSEKCDHRQKQSQTRSPQITLGILSSEGSS